MKKTLLFAVTLALCACAGANFGSRPTAEISRFDIDSLSLRDITFVFDISITNPYPVGISLESLKTDFFVEGKQAFSTETSGGLKIPARQKSVTSLLVTLKYIDIIGIISDYAKKDYLSTLIKTEIVIPLPELPGMPPSLKFSYDLEKKIPAVKPRISLANFRVQEPSADEITAALKAAGKATAQNAVSSALSSLLGGKTTTAAQQTDLSSLDLPLVVSFDIELANETAAVLEFAELDYDFAVNGAPLVKGLTREITRRGNVSVVSVANRFSTRSLGSALVDAFRSGSGEFSLGGGTAVRFPEEIRKTPVPLRFTEGGKFNLR